MKTYKVNRTLVYGLTLIVILGAGLATATRLSRARTPPTTNITVTNNSSREIWHLFLSPPDSNKWSADQLQDSKITPDHSATLSDVSCDQANIKVIAEDQNGCFLYQTVACGGNVTWTITNDATPDCGN